MANNPPVKSITIILALILAAEIAAVAVIGSAISNQTELIASQDAAQNQSDILARATLVKNLPDMVQFKTDEGFFAKLKLSELTTKALSIRVPKNPSLSDYFFDETGTSKPAQNPDGKTALKTPAIDEEKLGTALLGMTAKINREPQDAILEIEGDRATKFQPDLDGQQLDLARARADLQNLLFSPTSTLLLEVSEEPAKVRIGDLNNLGIKDFLGRGQSDATGSSAARLVNVKVGASRYHGVIIKPGEEFAFNEHLGPIDGAHGFLPELVIKPGGTVPEFGGGLCQVATTAFRAAFFSGLPITTRRNHSYAVHYYEWIADDRPLAVGLDATIYPGAQDLKFINDTPAAILIATHVEGKRVYFDFYGTADGRTVTMDGPHPYNRQASGAVKSKVTRTVILPGQEPKIVTFNSNYLSPALFPKITSSYTSPKPESETPAQPTTN